MKSTVNKMTNVDFMRISLGADTPQSKIREGYSPSSRLAIRAFPGQQHAALFMTSCINAGIVIDVRCWAP